MNFFECSPYLFEQSRQSGWLRLPPLGFFLSILAWSTSAIPARALEDFSLERMDAISVEDTKITIRYSAKLFANAQDPWFEVARGEKNLQATATIQTQDKGKITCGILADVAKVATGPVTTSASKVIPTSQQVGENLIFSLASDGRIVCKTDQDRKVQVALSIEKASLRNSSYTKIVEITERFKAKQNTLSKEQILFLDSLIGQKRQLNIPLNDPTITPLYRLQNSGHGQEVLILAEISRLLGHHEPGFKEELTSVGIPGTQTAGSGAVTNKKDVEENFISSFNRLALVCGEVTSEGQLLTPFILDNGFRSFVIKDPSQHLGCIVNNTREGYMDAKTANDKSSYKVSYVAASRSEFLQALEEERLKLIKELDGPFVEKLKAVAGSIIESNKLRVADELNRRRFVVLQPFGVKETLEVRNQVSAYRIALQFEVVLELGANSKIQQNLRILLANPERGHGAYSVPGQTAFQSEFTPLDWTAGEIGKPIRILNSLITSEPKLKSREILLYSDADLARFKALWLELKTKADGVQAATAPELLQAYRNLAEFVGVLTAPGVVKKPDFVENQSASSKSLHFLRFEPRCYQMVSYEHPDLPGKKLTRFRSTVLRVYYSESAAYQEVAFTQAGLEDKVPLFEGGEISTLIEYRETFKSAKILCQESDWLDTATIRLEDLGMGAKNPKFKFLLSPLDRQNLEGYIRAFQMRENVQLIFKNPDVE